MIQPTYPELHDPGLRKFVYRRALETYGKFYNGSQVCLRINPDVVAGETANVATGGDLSKFGILLEDVKKAVAIAKENNIKIVGLHEHTGSGIADTGKVFQSMQNLLGIINPEDFPDLEFVDFGRGFKVPYEPGEVEIDYEKFGVKAVELFSEFCDRYGKKLKLYFEPGKFTVAELGIGETVTITYTYTVVATDGGR